MSWRFSRSCRWFPNGDNRNKGIHQWDIGEGSIHNIEENHGIPPWTINQCVLDTEATDYLPTIRGPMANRHGGERWNNFLSSDARAHDQQKCNGCTLKQSRMLPIVIGSSHSFSHSVQEQTIL